MVSGGGIAGWREDTAEMYRVRMGNGEILEVYAREKTSLRGGLGGGKEGEGEKGMNGDCRPRGRDEWPGTHGGNGGETRARRTRERKDPKERRRRRDQGKSAMEREIVSHR